MRPGERFGVVGDEARHLSTPAPVGGSSTTRPWRPSSWRGCGRRWTRAASGSEFETDWVCLDCELMPWSAKAQELLQSQYAAVGAAGAGVAGRGRAARCEQARERAGRRPANAADLRQSLTAIASRRWPSSKFVAAYRQYCWPVNSLDDLKLAPFHLLATEGKVHVDRDHVWHMETLAEVCRHDPALLLATPYKVVDRDRPGRARRTGTPGGRS